MADRWPLERVLSRACAAGVDTFLVCKEPERQLNTFETLVRLQEEDATQDTLAQDSARRVMALRERFLLRQPPAPGLEVLDSVEHRDLVMPVRARGEEG